MSIRLKRALGRIWPCRRSRDYRKLILLYHSVSDNPWAVSKRTFRNQVEWLQQAARLVSVEHLLSQDLRDPLQVAITFDDGYANLHDDALPVLNDFGVAATVFANTSCIGAAVRNPSNAACGHYPNELFLSWRDIEHLKAAGWTVGSHGVNHVDLTAVDEEVATVELVASKRAIEDALLVPCTLFAYTWGRNTPRLRQHVADAGYQYAFSGRHEPVRADVDSFAVPRINISNEYTLGDFKAVVSGDWDYLAWVQRMKGL